MKFITSLSATKGDMCSMEKILQAVPIATTVDLTPWKEFLRKLVNLLSLECQKTKKAKEQCKQMELELTQNRKIPSMSTWVTE
ncbi:hypothetical protein R1sor_011007 [Riccia sorocarpa]|uniref:Uncharacterized protein n=1 Tax=Riccia sorocarpa TaxID=122646 RepID=A0ABD3I128_9MARC